MRGGGSTPGPGPVAGEMDLERVPEPGAHTF